MPLRKRLLDESSLLEGGAVLLPEERELYEADWSYRDILEGVTYGVVAVGRDVEIVYMNHVAAEMFGCDARAVAHAPATVLAKDLRNADGSPLRVTAFPIPRALQTADMTSAVCYRLQPSGRQRAISIVVKPVVHRNGHCLGAVAVCRDVTEELEQNAAQMEFVSVASHQLRTPLGLVKWYVDALKRGQYIQQVPRIAKEYLDEIYASNERVIALVRNLLSVSRIDQGGVRDNPLRVDVRAMLGQVREEIGAVAERKGVGLDLILPKGVRPVLHIDPVRLHETVENLVANAIAYTPAGGTVAVRLRKRRGRLGIEVKDTGIGIPVADQKRIFSKFFRTTRAVIVNPGGTGLGLYVANSYVETWGGKILVRSRTGRGATFTIVLPWEGADNEKDTNSRR